ncbi:GtrA family protein [Clostridium akagii]|uniref:GtrA family protein n=1 Tax=Clostridium akagii TaxID=91623 RepID=UPI00055DD955|nr:GtrA family protein [Clostridium akagii]
MGILYKLKQKYAREDIKEKILYLLFGVITTLINILIYWALSVLFQMNYFIANVIAWFFSILFAFVTNKVFVFKSYNKTINYIIKEGIYFLLARLVSLALDSGTMFVLIQILKINGIYAKLVSNIFVVLFNYFASKFVIFRNKLEL